MSARPSLDLHAHIDPAIHPRELRSLGVVFAATRSLDEADFATQRNDEYTIWGVGCHPGLVKAHRAFEPEHFAGLIARTAFVSEVGLDGRSRVSLATQQATLDAILALLEEEPRITSLHSYQATEPILRALEEHPIKGAILHWWLGDRCQTIRAIELGCFFSVNLSSIRRTDLLDLIPPTRLLTETDHPFGDRSRGKTARPGLVTDVEEVLGRKYGLSAGAIRATVWTNLSQLVSHTGCAQLLPRMVRRQLMVS